MNDISHFPSKFRVYDRLHMEMYYPEDHQHDCQQFILTSMGQLYLLDYDRPGVDILSPSDYEVHFALGQNLQNIPLYDKDLIKSTSEDDEILLVFWNAGECGFEFKYPDGATARYDDFFHPEKLQIVGNASESPNLLKGAQFKYI